MSTDLVGETCLITGATSGIGRAVAEALARMGATLVLVARDRARGEETVAEIAERTDNRDVSLILGDLSVQTDVRRIAAEFLASDRPLHVLVNNAGVVNLRRTVTADGIEATFAVNHLAPFLLTNLLLDRLRRSAPARVVTVSSDAHKFGPLDFDDLQNERRYRAMRVYGQSKLANILFSDELARRLAGSGVTANSLHPGAVATGLGTNNGAWARVVVRFLRPFFLTPDDGAKTVVWLASSPEVASISGGYFARCREHRRSRAARDSDAARRLWDISARMTGL